MTCCSPSTRSSADASTMLKLVNVDRLTNGVLGLTYVRR